MYIPRVQFWSFENRDPMVQVAGYAMTFQLFSAGLEENTFSLAADSIRQSQNGRVHQVRATALTTAGQQQRVAGRFEAEITEERDKTLLRMRAETASAPLRALKVTLHNLPPGRIGFTSWEAVPNMAAVPEIALALSYPSYQGGMPVWLLATEGERGISFSSLDTTMRPRRFVASRAANGQTQIELLFEEDARRWTTRLDTPAWEIRRDTTLDDGIAEREQLLQTQAGLRPWASRTDVPSWVRDIQLVVTLHSMHWSGYVFHDYAGMLNCVHWITNRIAGKNVLFFLAGWEGRYYRTYGNSRPNERMGGDAAFRALVRGIHSKGAHVMAMFAGNAAMPGTPGFAQYADGSRMQAVNSLNWTPMRGYAVDWSQVRGSNFDEAQWMNPGAPGWRNHLTNQVAALNRTYQLDGSFFDTQPNTENDRRYQPFEGLKQMVAELRDQNPNLMIATESWLDLGFTFLHAGQTPAPYKNWCGKYGRRFAHLSMAEPSRGSTGVHELGHVPYNFEDLMTLFDWPTVALVDTTLQASPEKVERVIQHAKSVRQRA